MRKDWHFTVDTSIPKLKLDGSADEGRINTYPATFSGTTEPYATVTVVDGDVKASGQADASGKYAVSAKLPDGPSDVTITTTDRAGNATRQAAERVRRRRSRRCSRPRSSTRVEKRRHQVPHQGHATSSACPRSSSCSTARSASSRARLQGQVRPSRTSPRASTSMVVTAADKGGNVVTNKQTFVVDSTEHFGSATMWPGARGKDVKELQKQARRRGRVLGQEVRRLRRPTPRRPCASFQAKYGLEVDGIVGGNVLNALSGQIVVDIGDLHLYLYRDGKLVKSYSVATGQPAYPTPTGTFSSRHMQMNPTWLPPNSDWAKDAKPIPPGADEPAGHALDRHERPRRGHPRHARTTPPSAPTPRTAASACTSGTSRTSTSAS